jgi:hypothetical protein
MKVELSAQRVGNDALITITVGTTVFQYLMTGAQAAAFLAARGL